MLLQDGKEQRERRKRIDVNYAQLDAGITAHGTVYGEDAGRFQTRLQEKAATFADTESNIHTLPSGADFTIPWLRVHGISKPILIRDREGLEFMLPGPEFKVRDVADTVGHDFPVDVIDVGSQTELPGWTMGAWADYFHKPAKREAVLNVISLEFSGTALEPLVRSPKVIRQIDWIDNVWPGHRHLQGQFPRVQYYCLMSVGGSWTDFHIDFGGTSVWYHVHTGKKTFLFVPPTEHNLRKYEAWTTSPNQSRTFFGDLLLDADTGRSQVLQVDLEAGNTLIIPTGWIHAVYTPEDSLVFGGNFLHGFDMPGQLRIYELELFTKVPRKYRFPYYEHMQWYAAAYYLQFTRLPAFPPTLRDALALLGSTAAAAGYAGVLGLLGAGGGVGGGSAPGSPASLSSAAGAGAGGADAAAQQQQQQQRDSASWLSAPGADVAGSVSGSRAIWSSSSAAARNAVLDIMHGVSGAAFASGSVPGSPAASAGDGDDGGAGGGAGSSIEAARQQVTAALWQMGLSWHDITGLPALVRILSYIQEVRARAQVAESRAKPGAAGTGVGAGVGAAPNGGFGAAAAPAAAKPPAPRLRLKLKTGGAAGASSAAPVPAAATAGKGGRGSGAVAGGSKEDDDNVPPPPPPPPAGSAAVAGPAGAPSVASASWELTYQQPDSASAAAAAAAVAAATGGAAAAPAESPFSRHEELQALRVKGMALHPSQVKQRRGGFKRKEDPAALAAAAAAWRIEAEDERSVFPSTMAAAEASVMARCPGGPAALLAELQARLAADAPDYLERIARDFPAPDPPSVLLQHRRLFGLPEPPQPERVADAALLREPEPLGVVGEIEGLEEPDAGQAAAAAATAAEGGGQPASDAVAALATGVASAAGAAAAGEARPGASEASAAADGTSSSAAAPIAVTDASAASTAAAAPQLPAASEAATATTAAFGPPPVASLPLVPPAGLGHIARNVHKLDTKHLPPLTPASFDPSATIASALAKGTAGDGLTAADGASAGPEAGKRPGRRGSVASAAGVTPSTSAAGGDGAAAPGGGFGLYNGAVPAFAGDGDDTSVLGWGYKYHEDSDDEDEAAALAGGGGKRGRKGKKARLGLVSLDVEYGRAGGGAGAGEDESDGGGEEDDDDSSFEEGDLEEEVASLADEGISEDEEAAIEGEGEELIDVEGEDLYEWVDVLAADGVTMVRVKRKVNRGAGGGSGRKAGGGGRRGGSKRDFADMVEKALEKKRQREQGIIADEEEEDAQRKRRAKRARVGTAEDGADGAGAGGFVDPLAGGAFADLDMQMPSHSFDLPGSSRGASGGGGGPARKRTVLGAASTVRQLGLGPGPGYGYSSLASAPAGPGAARSTVAGFRGSLPGAARAKGAAGGLSDDGDDDYTGEDEGSGPSRKRGGGGGAAYIDSFAAAAGGEGEEEDALEGLGAVRVVQMRPHEQLAHAATQQPQQPQRQEAPAARDGSAASGAMQLADAPLADAAPPAAAAAGAPPVLSKLEQLKAQARGKLFARK